VTSIARCTGWSMDYILWQLPYVTGLQIMHSEAVYNDNAVQYLHQRGSDTDDDIASAFSAMRKKKKD